MAKYNNISGAEALLLSLIEEKVDIIFGYPGGTIIPIYDKLYSYKDRLTHILTRHEQGAVHAAQGYTRATGKVGVCMATSGPGATNLITGIADAMVDSTPLVCITAQVGTNLLGSDAFQEADMISMTMPITKWNFQVTDASELSSALSKAFYIARSGRPGPVVLEFTKTAQTQLLESFHYEPCTSLRSYNPTPKLPVSIIEEAAELLNKAEKPLIIVGQGAVLAGAEKSVIALAEKIGAPIASSLMALSAVPSSHPQYIGMVGMHGTVAANVMSQESDVILSVGMRFSDRVTGDIKRYAPKAKIIHIDIDNSEINKVVNSYIGITADALAAVDELLKHTVKASHDSWFKMAEKCYKKEFDLVINKSINSDNETLQMGKAINAIATQTKGNAVIVTDVGQQQMYAARYSKFNHPRSFITSGGLGTMGYGLPAAIGAKLGEPNKEVIAVLGDGGFQMTMQELGTIAQNNIGVKIVILNNSFLGMVRQWQQLFFDRRYSYTELQNPDFTTIASAYGIKSEKVHTNDKLDSAIEKMLKHNGSYLLEIIVDREENVFPMVPAGNSISEQMCNE